MDKENKIRFLNNTTDLLKKVVIILKRDQSPWLWILFIYLFIFASFYCEDMFLTVVGVLLCEIMKGKNGKRVEIFQKNDYSEIPWN